jgi:hypothetical protein
LPSSGRVGFSDAGHRLGALLPREIAYALPHAVLRVSALARRATNGYSVRNDREPNGKLGSTPMVRLFILEPTHPGLNFRFDEVVAFL